MPIGFEPIEQLWENLDLIAVRRVIIETWLTSPTLPFKSLKSLRNSLVLKEKQIFIYLFIFTLENQFHRQQWRGDSWMLDSSQRRAVTRCRLSVEGGGLQKTQEEIFSHYNNKVTNGKPEVFVTVLTADTIITSIKSLFLTVSACIY